MSQIVTDSSLIDDALEAWASALGEDAAAYRGHAYRVFNFSRALAGTSGATADEATAVAAAFHDIGIWSDATVDYLEPSIERALTYLTDHGHLAWSDEVTRMIEFHHKLTRYRGAHEPLVESFRKADLIDVSLGALTAGLPRTFVNEVRSTFPNAGFHSRLRQVLGAWILRHPLRPLPMMKL